MKRWHKRTLCILVLGVAGLVALAYRPAFCRDCAEKNKFLRDAVSELSKHDNAQGINLHYTWHLTKHPNGTLLMGDTQPDAFSMLQHATWDIDIRTQNGKIEATCNTPVLHAQDSTHLVKTEYRAYFTRPTLIHKKHCADFLQKSLHNAKYFVIPLFHKNLYTVYNVKATVETKNLCPIDNTVEEHTTRELGNIHLRGTLG